MNFLRQYKKYGSVPSSHDFIKFFALIIMIIDHIGHYFFPEQLMWRAVGRIGFPVWFFLSGYAKKSDGFPKELFVFAVLLVVVDLLFNFPLFSVNALFTIFLCRYFVHNIVKEKINRKSLIIWVALLIIYYYPSALLFEYGSLALLFALWGYLYRNNPKSSASYAMAITCCVLFIGTQFVEYDFVVIEYLIMMCGTIAVVFCLQNFKTSFYQKLDGNLFCKIAMFFGRNTLYMYFIHICLFVVLSYFMYIEEHQEFSWF